MAEETRRRVVLVVASSAANRKRIEAIARWTRALVPTAMLVVSPFDKVTTEVLEDAIAVDAEALPSGPLSLADALARAAMDS